MGGMGLLVGWVLWGGPGVVEVRPVRERVVAGDRGADFFAEWMRAEGLEGALVGFCVMDEEGEVVYGSPLAETALCPASAIKTLTAGAAFGLLGEDFRFETVVTGGSGISREGVVTGDLVLKGGGDPTLVESDLVALAEDLVGKGLKRVEGSLRMDASIFPEAAVSDHWVWGDLGNAYGAGAFGVNVGRNVMRLAFDGGAKVGDAAVFSGSVPDLEVEWDVRVMTGAAGSGDGVMVYASPYGKKVEARGTVPLGARGFVVRGAVPDPPRLAGQFLRSVLTKRGVVFSGERVSEKMAEVELARHVSAELGGIVDHMQAVSDNLAAQCLFLMIGVKAGKDPVVAMRGYWEEMGVDFRGLRLIDGSGLARASMIRPVDLARANFLARKAGYGERFFESLPGDDSVRSKRGAMSGVRTEVGFVRRGGKVYVFALMGNGLVPGVDFWRMREVLLERVLE